MIDDLLFVAVLTSVATCAGWAVGELLWRSVGEPLWKRRNVMHEQNEAEYKRRDAQRLAIQWEIYRLEPNREIKPWNIVLMRDADRLWEQFKGDATKAAEQWIVEDKWIHDHLIGNGIGKRQAWDGRI